MCDFNGGLSKQLGCRKGSTHGKFGGKPPVTAVNWGSRNLVSIILRNLLFLNLVLCAFSFLFSWKVGAGNLCLGHHFQNLHFYVRVMMFWCVPFCQNTRCNIPWGMFISVESSSPTPISILNASYSLFGCVTRKAMVRYLDYYRLFINARQCFIVAFLTHAHAQVNRLPIAESWLYYLLAGYGTGRLSVRRF
jgi:hypothetical protein